MSAPIGDNRKEAPKIALYGCENSCALAAQAITDSDFWSTVDLISVSCSGRVESTVMLKTLERGYAGIIVIGCPEDNCKYVSGNKRAAKRVSRVRSMLADAGLDAGIVVMGYVSSVDPHKVMNIVGEMRQRIAGTPARSGQGAPS